MILLWPLTELLIRFLYPFARLHDQWRQRWGDKPH